MAARPRSARSRRLVARTSTSGDDTRVAAPPPADWRCPRFPRRPPLVWKRLDRKTLGLEDAEVAGSFVEPRRAESLRSIGRRVAEVVAVLPHGFAHGDFFTRNLLVDGSRIVGVVDWDAAGPGRPPLLDFLHLWHMGRHKVGDLDWGPTKI